MPGSADPAAGAGERDSSPGRGLLRPGGAPRMKFPLVFGLSAEGVPVAVACRVLSFPKQAF